MLQFNFIYLRKSKDNFIGHQEWEKSGVEKRFKGHQRLNKHIVNGCECSAKRTD